MSTTGKIRTTAKVVRATGRFCLNPFCLHVAGNGCKSACCKIKKSKTSTKKGSRR